jgi:hypothetical protein
MAESGRGGLEMRGVSYVQQGVVACREFIKLLMIGSNGRLEASLPATDDERRDVEVHLKGRFGPSLSFQVKSARQLVHKGRMDYLVIFMSVKANRVRNNPRFWYFFACLDFGDMAFKDPVFVVPSTHMHRAGAHGSAGDLARFVFKGSMQVTSRDTWQPYRVEPRAVGQRVLDILKDLPSKRGIPR